MKRKLNKVYEEIEEEVERATRMHGPFFSKHEFYGVLMEEVSELMDELRSNNPYAFRKELIQCAAMCSKALQQIDKGDI